ncbi:MAG: phosphomannomutase/phosphoglucomutase [Lachnospiraceae bacterium]|nr:phosphomannomutase/phosphoglucomutase [Lachnospiraceae bacterium]
MKNSADKNYTYIIQCADGSLYTGWTNDLVKRLRAHNEGKGAKYTKSRRPVELRYFELHNTKEEAMSSEWHIKQLTKKKKLDLIIKNARGTAKMDAERYRRLQNGSDIRGIAMEGIVGEQVNLTQRVAYFIGAAFAEFVAKQKSKAVKDIRVAIGHDSRITAEPLKRAFINGLKAAGVHVTDCHLASTPSLFMATVLEDLTYDGTVMMTASHLPYNRNGFKFFTNQGGLEKAHITTILERAYALDEQVDGEFFLEKSADDEYDLLGRYSEHLRMLIKKGVNKSCCEKPLEGLHIVVDAGNGAGGFFATQVLKPLGANISGSQFLEPDGMFPNHIPNPEDKDAMEAIQRATMKHKADLGLIFDTDVDRSAAVFADGTPVSRNAFIAIMAAIIEKEYPGTTIVTDSVTSDELAMFLEQTLGMKHWRFKRGYKNVINEAIRLNKEGMETHLAMETSGHGALKENYFLDDGAYLCVKMVIELAKRHACGEKIESLIQELKYPEDEKEIRFKVKADDFPLYGEQVLKEFKAYCEKTDGFTIVPNNHEGVRVAYQDEQTHGWMLLRMSLHDPLLPLNVEAKEKGGVERMLNITKDFFDKLNVE